MTGLLVRPPVACWSGDRTVVSARPIVVFRALSDPLRCQLLAHLRERGEVPRSELQRLLGVTKTMLTYHTRALLQAGLIEVSGTARALVYRIHGEAMRELEGWLTEPRSASAAESEEPACGRR